MYAFNISVSISNCIISRWFRNLEDRFRNISLNIDHSDRRLLCERKTSASSSTTSDSSGTASTASASKFHLLKMNQTTSYNSNQLFDPNTNEPIYAVVNLKNKYEHRAKKKLADESYLDNFILRRERPNSFHVNSGEYEEVRWTSLKEIIENERKLPHETKIIFRYLVYIGFTGPSW